MNIEPAPAADEVAAIIVALARLRQTPQSPGRHSAWRTAARMPWLTDDEIRALAAAHRKP